MELFYCVIKIKKPPPDLGIRRRFFLRLFKWHIVGIENLGAFHEASFMGWEGLAPMHGGAVVPHDEVADLPLVCPDKLGLGDMVEQGVE